MKVIFFAIAILIVAVLLFVAISLTKPHAPQLNKEKYQQQFSTAGMILSRYYLFCNQFNSGLGSKNDLSNLFKVLTKSIEGFKMVKIN